ncbi:acyltransferase [Nocardioides sp. zg-1230]|uniref:acyltransferase family protein n=1 Tax=Nocardioides sp. zg-1230 TaxID=2736601 RepID=UPI001555BCCC|nr:acyltransferase [Nocardioides sp. zg-1230]NPC44300.1 acyltransferase [Nocardioides sp. zg-1230]
MSDRPHTVVRDRVQVFDGLRGIAIVLVMLSHTAWLTWPHVRGEGSIVTRALLENGNFAVSIFFVVGAFLYTRSLLTRASAPNGLHPGVQVVRRYLRLTPTVLVLLGVLACVAALEPTPTYEGLHLGDSARSVVTYTWNWYVKDNPLVARPDLGHLWYLSVDMQVFLLVLLLVWLLHKRPWWLIGTLAVILMMVFTWRTHVYQTEGLYQALLRTNARMDAPLSGALAACLLPYVRGLARWATQIAVTSLLALLALSFATVDDVAFFRVAGDSVDVFLALFVIACSVAPVSHRLTRVVGFAPLAYLGRRSLSLYIWHFPIYMYLYHHTESWSYQLRTVVAVALTVAVAAVNDRTVEHWVGRALIDPRWSRLDRGAPAYLSALTRAAVRHTSASAPRQRADDTRPPARPSPATDKRHQLSGAEAHPAAPAASEQPRPTRPDDA